MRYSKNKKTNRCSLLLIIMILAYFLFNVLLLLAPFFILPENDSKTFWTLIITNVHILFLLFVTMSQNVYLVTSWLFIDVLHVLYFCYVCVVLVTQFIEGMGSNSSSSCSLFSVIPPEGILECIAMRIQFKSVATVVIIVLVIIPVEVWLFISVTGYCHRQLLSSSTKILTRGTQTNLENKPLDSFTTFRLRGITKEKPISAIQGDPQIDLINGDTNLIEIDSSYELPLTNPKRTSNKKSFLSESIEQDKLKMSKQTATSTKTKRSIPSSMLSNYSARILPALKF